MGDSNWLGSLHPVQLERVRAVIRARRADQREARRGYAYGLSIVLDRSVGVPRKITLRYRDGHGRLIEDVEIDATVPVSQAPEVAAAWSEV